MHLHGLVEVTNDLAILARQVDQRELTGMFRMVDWPSRKARVLKETAGQMLSIQAESVRPTEASGAQQDARVPNSRFLLAIIKAMLT